MPSTRPVASNSTEAAFDYVAKGGRLVIRTALNITIIDKKVLNRFKKAGAWLLKAEGDGYRMQRGNGSVYLLPGQLEFVIED